MAENEPKNVESSELVEDEKKEQEVEADNGSHVLFDDPVNIKGTGQDEVDEGNTGPKRKKSGILGRLSTRKKKKKPSTKEDNVDDSKSDSNVDLTNVESKEKTSDEIDQGKTVDTEENVDAVSDEIQDEEKATDGEETSQVEEEKKVEETVEGDDGSLYEVIVEPENVETTHPQDEVNDGGQKQKKSGLLRRLSARKKKKKPTDESKSESNVEVSDNACDGEEKAAETEDNAEEKHEETKDEGAGKQEVCESENTESKKKKPGRLRRLSFSKMKKSKKQKEKEDTEEISNEGTENNEDEKKCDDDSITVQNVQEKCDVPETVDQSEDTNESIQPITDDIEVEKEQEEKETCKNADCLENIDSANKSYLSAVVEIPVDIAQRALQTIKQVFKPVIVYLIKKNPHCFKDVIEKNKKNACCPTQL